MILLEKKNEIFGKRLKELRNRTGKSQEEVATKIGISRARYSHYENNHVEPDIELIRVFSEYYNVPTDYLLGISNNPHFENTYDSLEELKKITEELGIKDLAFYDINQWKNLTKEDVEDIKKHFEFIIHKAKERKKDE